MSNIAATLRSLGVLPADFDEATLADDADDATRFADSLQRRIESGARLTWGWPANSAANHSLPDHRAERFTAWCGPRLVFWPRGRPAELEKLVGIFSSRLSRQLERHRAWFAALRTACLRIDGPGECLLTVASTTAERFVERCGALFGRPVLVVEVAAESDSLAAWLRRIGLANDDDDPLVHRVQISPPVTRSANEVSPEIPFADRVLAALSDRLIGLAIRPGGHWHRLVQRRLADPAFAPASVFLAIVSPPEETAGTNVGVSSPELLRELMQAGAIGWLLRESKEGVGSPFPVGGKPITKKNMQLPTGKGLPTPLAGAVAADRPPWSVSRNAPAAASAGYLCADSIRGEFLLHCTRSRSGPWPGQSDDEFLDDLILDRSEADHSALAALCRIAASRRLIASADRVRGGTPVVSFTAVPLADLATLRAFRSHLAHWDFEPFGIGISRAWLELRGARPAIYGDEATWQSLPPLDQPYFQVAQSVTASGRIEDWTREREWRSAGDLPLTDLPADAAFLFVPNSAAAEVITAISPWPIVVLAPGTMGHSV